MVCVICMIGVYGMWNLYGFFMWRIGTYTINQAPLLVT